MLNVASTRIFTILTLIVNLKWYACQKWTSLLKLVVILAQYCYTKTAQRIFKYSDIQYINLTLDKILNSLIYRTLFYVNIYGSYKLLKTVRFFWPTLWILLISLWWPSERMHFWTVSQICIPLSRLTKSLVFKNGGLYIVVTTDLTSKYDLFKLTSIKSKDICQQWIHFVVSVLFSCVDVMRKAMFVGQSL